MLPVLEMFSVPLFITYQSPDVTVPLMTAVFPLPPVVKPNHFVPALIVVLKLIVRPLPNILMPLTDDPLTVSVPLLPNVRSPLTALISPNGFGGDALLAAKVIGTFSVT